MKITIFTETPTRQRNATIRLLGDSVDVISK